MRAHVLLLVASYPFVFGCTVTDEGPGATTAGTAGQSSSVGGGGSGAGGAAGTSSVAGTPSAGNTNGGVVNGTAGSSPAAGSSSGGNTSGGSTSGGASGSGGTSNGGGSAGTTGAGGAIANGCAGVTNAKFCEDWDKLPMGKPSGDYSISGGGVVDTSKAFSGAQSLHFQKMAKPAGETPAINFTKQFPLASNDMHGRAMVFMAQTPKTGSHWNFITSSNSGNTEWSIGGQYGNFELVCDPPDNGLDSKTAFPGGKWVCMQWEFKYAGLNADTTFVTKVDGVSVDQGEFTGANSKNEKWKAGTWNNLKLGWEIFGSSDIDVEFWIDDLAFGEQVIACPAK